MADEYKIVRDDQKNQALIEKLLSVESYIDHSLPEWKQLIKIGGFVADVIKALKWSEHKPPFNSYHRDQAPQMTCDEICEEIWVAIDYTFSSHYADEMNAIWNGWNTDSTKYPEAKTVEDILDKLIEIVEKDYPGLKEYADSCFHFSEE